MRKVEIPCTPESIGVPRTGFRVVLWTCYMGPGPKAAAAWFNDILQSNDKDDTVHALVIDCAGRRMGFELRPCEFEPTHRKQLYATGWERPMTPFTVLTKLDVVTDGWGKKLADHYDAAVEVMDLNCFGADMVVVWWDVFDDGNRTRLVIRDA